MSVQQAVEIYNGISDVIEIADNLQTQGRRIYNYLYPPMKKSYGFSPIPGRFNWGRRDVIMGGASSGRYHTSRKRARSMSRKPNFSQGGYIRKGGYYGRYNGPFAQETKFLDVTVSDAIVATGGLIIGTVNVIPQGTTESQRIGRKVVISKILFKYSFDLPSSATMTETSDIFRVILYVDKQCNGAAPAITDILVTANVRSFRALDNSDRFQILMDRTEAINATVGSGDGAANDSGITTRFRKFYKTCSIPIEYDSTSGVIAEIKSNNVGLCVLSEAGFVGFFGRIRLRYKG